MGKTSWFGQKERSAVAFENFYELETKSDEAFITEISISCQLLMIISQQLTYC